MNGTRSASLFVLFAIGMLASCKSDSTTAAAPPAIASAQVFPLADNSLGAIVSAVASNVDSIRVEYRIASLQSSAFSITPGVDGSFDTYNRSVLGLLPNTRYEMRVVALGAGGSVTGQSMFFTSGPLPSDLPAFTASGSDPSPGFVVFAAGNYGLAIDNSGRVVWYHHFPDGPGLNFMPQPDGRFAARPSTSDPLDYEPFVEIDPFGVQVRTLACNGGLNARVHDLYARDDGSFWIMCDEVRSMDLTSFGGNTAAQVMGTVVQHIGTQGNLLFSWNSFDHFSINDLDPDLRTPANVNWTHGNSFDIDTDGNLLVSFRSLNEITKINAVTGQVIWRLGGRASQFQLTNGSTAFRQQHSLRVTGVNEFIILDNSGNPSESRAEKWVVDPVLHTARIIQSFGATPPVMTPLGGSTQQLPNGRTLVSYGNQGRVEEYDAQGNVRWRIDSGAGFVFRALRISSLYDPALNLSR